MEKINKVLLENNERLMIQNERLTAQVEEQTKQIKYLNEQLSYLTRKMFGASSEKTSEKNQLSLFDEPEVSEVFMKRRKPK